MPADLVQRVIGLVAEDCARADDLTHEQLEQAVEQATTTEQRR